MSNNETITVNGKVYKARELDFNFLCELGEQGIELNELSKKILPATRVYIAYCMGVDVKVAGEAVNKHIINGGTFNDFIDVFNQKALESDFFRSLNRETETDQEEAPKKSTKKSEKEASE